MAVDQHLLVRRRADDLVDVIAKKPELLGLGLDEPAAIVVQGDRMEVIGRSVVGIYDGKEHDGKRYYFLAPGEVFDLAARKRVEGKKRSAGIRKRLLQTVNCACRRIPKRPHPGPIPVGEGVQRRAFVSPL